jgi:hypothetical protein
VLVGCCCCGCDCCGQLPLESGVEPSEHVGYDDDEGDDPLLSPDPEPLLSLLSLDPPLLSELESARTNASEGRAPNNIANIPNARTNDIVFMSEDHPLLCIIPTL